MRVMTYDLLIYLISTVYNYIIDIIYVFKFINIPSMYYKIKIIFLFNVTIIITIYIKSNILIYSISHTVSSHFLMWI